VIPAPRRALVIEDNPAVRTVVRGLLQWSGYEVRCASDGAEGLRLFEPGRDDLLVTDLMMLGITGWEVAETLRRSDPGLAVVIVTGSLRDFDARRVRDLRVVVLPKPFTLRELRAAVDEARLLAAIPPAATIPVT
jgi:CheY-like chemotaxis protein